MSRCPVCGDVMCVDGCPTCPDPRDPRPCPACGQVCTYDGWGHVHPSGVGIGSCVTPPLFDEGDDVMLSAKVYRADGERALIEFRSMEGPFSVRVPLSELTRVIPPEVTAP